MGQLNGVRSEGCANKKYNISDILSVSFSLTAPFSPPLFSPPTSFYRVLSLLSTFDTCFHHPLCQLICHLCKFNLSSSFSLVICHSKTCLFVFRRLRDSNLQPLCSKSERSTHYTISCASTSDWNCVTHIGTDSRESFWLSNFQWCFLYRRQSITVKSRARPLPRRQVPTQNDWVAKYGS